MWACSKSPCDMFTRQSFAKWCSGRWWWLKKKKEKKVREVVKWFAYFYLVSRRLAHDEKNKKFSIFCNVRASPLVFLSWLIPSTTGLPTLFLQLFYFTRKIILRSLEPWENSRGAWATALARLCTALGGLASFVLSCGTQYDLINFTNQVVRLWSW